MIRLRVNQGPDDYDNCWCNVLESDSTHGLIRGDIKVDFALCNSEVVIKPGDIVTVDNAVVYATIAGKIIDIEHNEA